eukprot:Gb_08198 [translate_table: standard]
MDPSPSDSSGTNFSQPSEEPGTEKDRTWDVPDSISSNSDTRRGHGKLNAAFLDVVVPMDFQNEFSLLAASIQRCTAGMSRWSMAELTLGLYKLFQCHVLEGAVDTISGSQVEDIEELEEMHYWFKWAMAAYEKDRSSIAKCLQINELQIKKHVRISSALRPSYYIALDNLKSCLVMAIRGTQSTTDIMTDLNPHSEKFGNRYGHSGMLAAAKWLMDEESENLQILLKAHPGHKLVLTGHSLGAGTASLLCILFHESSNYGKKQAIRINVPACMVTCWGFGCPPCLDKELSQQSTYIRNIVLQDDLIVRLSPAALEDLRTEILEIDWFHSLADNGKMKKIVELAKSTHGILNNIETSLGYEHGYFYRQIKSHSYASLAAAKDQITTRWTEYRLTNESKARTISDWLSYGASSVRQCVEMISPSTITSRQTREVVATIDANATAVNDTNKSVLGDVKLFVPGILYHVLRGKDSPTTIQPVRPIDGFLRSNYNIATSTDIKIAGKDADTSPTCVGEYENKKESSFETDLPVQYTVTRGGDLAFRFTRIVLSTSMLSDHGCQSYQAALEGAIDCARQVRKYSGDVYR